MKIREAHWEIRNLGVTCSEIEIEDIDTPDEIASELATVSSQYQVARAPVARIDILRKLESLDFQFIECLFEVSHDLNEIEVADILTRAASSITYSKVADQDLIKVEDEIRKGIFSTDRVVLDSEFSPKQASDRYVNWLRDEVARGGSVYEISHNEFGIGFFTFREDGSGQDNSVLSGLYKGRFLPGVGNALLMKVLEEARRRKLPKLTSHISSNNLAVVKTHQALGFYISDIRYIYVKHDRQGVTV